MFHHGPTSSGHSRLLKPTRRTPLQWALGPQHVSWGDTRLPSTARVPAISASALVGISGRQLGTRSVCTPNGKERRVAPAGTCCPQPAHRSRPPCRALGSCPSDSSERWARPAQHSRRGWRAGESSQPLRGPWEWTLRASFYWGDRGFAQGPQYLLAEKWREAGQVDLGLVSSPPCYFLVLDLGTVA